MELPEGNAYSSVKQTVKKHAAAIAAVCFYLVAIRLLDTTCLVLYFTRHKCPACGSTRAIWSLLHGNVSAYMAYNPFALPLGIALLCMIHLKKFKHGKTVEIISLLIVFAAFIRWIIKM